MSLISPTISVAFWGYGTPPHLKGPPIGLCPLSGGSWWKQSIREYFRQPPPVDFIKPLLRFPRTLSGGPPRVIVTAERGIIVSEFEWDDISTSSLHSFSVLFSSLTHFAVTPWCIQSPRFSFQSFSFPALMLLNNIFRSCDFSWRDFIGVPAGFVISAWMPGKHSALLFYVFLSGSCRCLHIWYLLHINRRNCERRASFY